MDASAGRSRIATGDWVSRSRVRSYAWMLVTLYALVVGWTFATAHGLLDARGRPLGTDFANVWSAGKLVNRGSATHAYDPAAQHAEQQRIFDDPDVPFYGWHYPPYTLAIAAALATLPYLIALGVWQAATGAFYVATARRILGDGDAWLPALAFPPVLLNLTHGQNGFLSAALLASGLLALRARPVLAGVLLGLLAYKPQLGLLVPFALVAGGHGRAFAAAAATVVALALGSFLWLGEETWRAFFSSAQFTTSIVLEAGGTSWHKQQSLFAWVRRLGGSSEIAWALQLLLATVCAGVVVRVWSRPASHAARSAALAAGSLLATPYVYDYDLVLAGTAIAFLAARGLRDGFLPYERTLLAGAFIAPLFARVVAARAPVPLGLATLVLLLAAAVWRAAAEADHGLRPEPASSSPTR